MASSVMSSTEIMIRLYYAIDTAGFSKKDIDIDYLDCKYRFMLVESNQESSEKYALSSSIYHMMNWFGISRCLVLTPHQQQQVLPSLAVRRILYSAAVCAAEALHCSIPIFVTSTTIDALHRAREILGYSLLTPADSRGRGGDDVYTVYYESALMEGVVAKHNLFYVDGLLGLYGLKLSEFSNGSVSLAGGLGLVNVIEHYFYRLTENDRFLIRSVAYNTDSKKLKLHPEIKSCIEDMAAAFPDRDDMSASLNKLVVKVDYGVRRFGRGYDQVDDNEFYTTLHPSVLPFECWEVHAEFLPLRNGRDLEPQGLAFCLRQLLALYIAGKCCPSGQTVINMSGKNGHAPAIDRAKALSIATVLSIRSRDAVSAVCSNSQTQYVDENGQTIGSSGSIPQDLLMRVFSRSMWIDIDETSSSDGGGEKSTAHSPGDESSTTFGAAEKSYSYGISTSPWNWMVDLNSAPVGSWLNLVALFSGSLPDFTSMCFFWAECCHQLRVHAETGVPVPRLHPPQPVSGSSVTSGVHLFPEKNLELWQRSLWDDVLEDRALKRMPFSLPDTDRCLIFQKLQMLQLCIMCGDEEVTVNTTGKGKELAVLKEASSLHKQEPRLQRRLPMTTDMNAHSQYIQDKLTSGKSRSGAENPLLRWQVSLPSVVSDTRSFKAVNANASFDEFLKWYSPCAVPIDTLKEIFSHCTPALAVEQNALFKAEKEIERVLGYLESLNPCQLTAEMLCTAMISMHMVLYFDVMDSISSSDTNSIHCQLLFSLRNQIEVAIKMIREDVPSLQDSPNESVSQHALLAVDKVCSTIQNLEETKARADSCRVHFQQNQRLRSELSLHGQTCAETTEEANHLFTLSKNASRGENHTWHSVDGRELGAPDVKNFDFWLLPEVPEALCGILKPEEVALPFSDVSMFRSVLKSGTTPYQHMHATCAGEDLRVSLMFQEASHL